MAQKGWTHIIVGAGAAGCVLAHRLSENRDFNVLLIEAGGSGAMDPTLKVPMMTAVLLRGKRHVWQYLSDEEAGLEKRRISLPRGKVLGGSTAINGMVYARGLGIDYDQWAQSGLADWSWSKVRPSFLKSEIYCGKNNSELHNQTGLLTVSDRQKPLSPLVDAFVEAGISAGYPRCMDFNHPDAEGFGFYDFTIRNGHRESAATAFLKSALNRKNLQIQTGCEVNKIIFDQYKATAIEVLLSGEKKRFHAEQEIILCAGAIGSPSILLRSGIGPAQELEEARVKPILDLPEVGKNLHDHVLIRVSYGAPQEVTLHGLTRADKAAAAFLQAWFFGTGPMTVFPLEAGAYIRTNGSDIPTIQSHFLPALSTATMRFNPFRNSANNQPGFMANASVMRPVSRGFIRLTGPEPTDLPKICVNYLEDDRDIYQLIEATEILRDVFAQKPFDAYRKEELSPGKEIRTKNALSSWIRQNASTVHHLCGSCRMGVDKNTVVDCELRVQGVEGLRIADASIFPSIPSANTAAPTMMVAEKAADYILREH